MNSKQGSRYIKRRMGNDLKQKILVQNGIISEQEIEKKPSILNCPRCSLVNAIENKYCSKCTYPGSPETCFMIGDSGYDDHKLYDLSTKRGFELVCPVQRYKNTPHNRLEMIQFYESELGQTIYSWRSKSIEEPLIEHIKSVFRIDPLPVRPH